MQLRVRRGWPNPAARELSAWCKCPTSAGASWRRGARYAPDLPPEHRLSSRVFGAGFKDLVDRVVRNPDRRHEYTVSNDEADVSFWFSPGDWLSTISHAPTSHSRDLQNNKVTNALGKKNSQISRSGWTGARGVFLCDGGFELFQSSGSPSLQSIVNHFLFENQSLDFVCSLSIKDRSWNFGERDLYFHPWLQTRYDTSTRKS